jgi:hypothetical protein
MKSDCIESVFLDDLSKIRSKDMVSIETIWERKDSRYLVIKVSKTKSFLELLPLEQFYKNEKDIEAPILAVPFYMIKNIKKIDKSNLLFLANNLNPHIINALEGM